MILITGPGRSGTSLVAAVYAELGFDPGGRWHSAVRAGLEDREIVDINRRVARYLGIGLFAGHRRRRMRAVRRAVRRSLKKRSVAPLRPRRLDARPHWERFDAAIERYGPRLCELSRSRVVAKDPRFAQTLRVWAAAGAEIDHVLVCVRSLDAMVDSRVAAGHAGRASKEVVRNSLVYHLGLCMTALIDYRLDYDVVRFPDFVQKPEILFDAMRFPAPVSREQFLEAFGRVARDDLVSEWR